ncbi:MAG: ATP-dependent sacrificial sulfur transferase LarE [Spirochaetia bacterium]|jgi:uncharacterized protein|nr:ATP-dependent sacrificial sulfur transferase LarE [Spirochaetia bacterium]
MTLEDFFALHDNCAVCFSGGCDSAYLLYEAMKSAKSVCAYYVRSAFQPQVDLEDAKKIADMLHAHLTIVDIDVLSDTKIRENSTLRCYYCKKAIMAAVKKQAEKDGKPVILDGTNASDEVSDRPGMKALEEEGILSPLRLCGLTKKDIRESSKLAGLSTWDKPANACLATRIPCGTELSLCQLQIIETVEDGLRKLGFSDFRVRERGSTARLEVPIQQLSMAIWQRYEILGILQPYFSDIVLDLKGRKGTD